MSADIRPIHVLQFGRSGQLGRELVSVLDQDAGIVPTILARATADFTKPDSIAAAVLAAPQVDVVVNAAAYTAVDRAESEEALADQINAQSVGRLAEACRQRNVPLVHVSTDYVYDGAKPSAYVESDAVNPLNVYGRTKLAGEDLIRARLPEHVILRTSWIYSAHGANFVKTMLRLGAERDELRIVDDQWGAPTSAGELAGAIATVVRRIAADRSEQNFGTFHFSSAGETSWRLFAEEIFRQADWAGIRARVTPIAASEYPTPARRPTNSRMDTRKIRAVFGITPAPWQTSLISVLTQLHASQS